jgi:hypothetical protein
MCSGCRWNIALAGCGALCLCNSGVVPLCARGVECRAVVVGQETRGGPPARASLSLRGRRVAMLYSVGLRPPG